MKFTVAVILTLALMLQAIQAVKPNKAISEIVTPIEELCPIINTDMNKDMDKMSRLRHENNLLQKNVN